METRLDTLMKDVKELRRQAETANETQLVQQVVGMETLIINIMRGLSSLVTEETK